MPGPPPDRRLADELLVTSSRLLPANRRNDNRVRYECLAVVVVASFQGGMASTAVTFRVQGKVEDGFQMYVVGDKDEIGHWISDTAIRLNCITEILVKSENSGMRELVEVIWWETNVQPRQCMCPDQDTLVLPVADFGTYDGSTTISNGWLKHQMAIQVRFHSSPIHMLKPKYQKETYSIQCFPLDYEPGMKASDISLESCTHDDDSHDGPPTCGRTAVYFTNLNSADQKPAPQPPFGCIYEKDDYLVFIARGANHHHVGFQLDFYVHIETAAPRLVGTSHLLPLENDVSFLIKKVPIIGLNHKPIGEVTVETFKITPLNIPMDMEVSYQNHWKWKTDGSTLNVGHRGMGSSYKYKKVSDVRENTIFSLLTAASNGADFVEFDVLLTKDQIPVIYHDFSVCLSYSQKDSHERQLFEIPVKDLKLEHLQSMKLYHSSSKHEEKIEVNPERTPENEQPFPTLCHCLETVDVSLGFNIEVKYPLKFETGESEMDNYFDQNMHTDEILKVVFKHAGSRKIIFSSFDPDTCIMLQMKQNKYPVLFLSNGPTVRYTPYCNWRCKTFNHGISFAMAEGLLGVNFQAEGLIRDIPLIQHIQSLGLVLFVWGEDLNEAHVKQLLRKHGVDGIIFDRMEKQSHESFLVNSASNLKEICCQANLMMPANSSLNLIQ
ncbi:hypothetical protein C0Q70_08601 [Pomacea canaliculata]|uniref:GP-PDE domain-containing protein n=1 Tax=Pomacea canaliculata TaxID=400727 RepID=A0A2T7PIA9_POMCA|nr:hypothetical protein C0Q70_08601 [Pomacea canaliculata]